MTARQLKPTFPANEDAPLVVDLDGTLLRTDMLLESMLLLLRQKPWVLFLLPFWLLYGKAHFKQQIAAQVQIDFGGLPYNEELCVWLRDEKVRGRHLALVSASDQSIVDGVASHVGFFDVAQGSDGRYNLRGANKLAFIESLYGNAFVYAGDAAVDQVIWQEAQACVLVGDVEHLKRLVGAEKDIERIFPHPVRNRLYVWLKAVRLHEWVKNALIFVPLALTGGVATWNDVSRAAMAFAIFGLTASATYIINDLLDLDADRRHQTKRNRPFASCALPVSAGLTAVILFALPVLLLAGRMGRPFALVLGGYVVVTLAYSFMLKRRAIIEVLTVAGLFTLRIAAGMVLLTLPPSYWLLTFSMFFFLSLALVKRYAELGDLGETADRNIPGRAHIVTDRLFVLIAGMASALAGCLVFVIYLANQHFQRGVYSNPQWLWGICAVLLYWLMRMWFLASRGLMNQDPILFALKDRASLAMGMLTIILLALAW